MFLKLTGAAYLVYLGIRLLLSARRARPQRHRHAPPAARLFAQGILPT